ncbi:sulfotransferase [Gaopeijia maritima]|uniref:sulfotransferase n=1 Tax=Gaopeijia maritima TaxID=3119007 RepID=UPI003246DFDA
MSKPPSLFGGLATLLGAALRAPFAGPASPLRWLALLLFLPPFVALQVVHWVALALDDLLFPAYRRVEVREPLFVLGLPRSGTTTLHRILARDEERFTTLRLWQLLFAPAIVERKALAALGAVDRAIGSPALRTLRWIERRLTSWMDEVHPISLDEPEEDYLFFLPLFAAFILVLVAPRDPRLWRISRADRSPAEADRLVAFYRRCVQRHLYLEGGDRRLLSKNPSFTPFIEALDRAFPDARFIGCVRAPSKVVASQLSSLADGARLMGWRVEAPEHRDRIVAMLVFYARHLVETFDALPSDRRDTVILAQWARDVPTGVSELYRRFGWTVSPTYAEALDDEGQRSRSHRSRHRYALADFGLDDAEVDPLFAALLNRMESA